MVWRRYEDAVNLVKIMALRSQISRTALSSSPIPGTLRRSYRSRSDLSIGPDSGSRLGRFYEVQQALPAVHFGDEPLRLLLLVDPGEPGQDGVMEIAEG